MSQEFTQPSFVEDTHMPYYTSRKRKHGRKSYTTAKRYKKSVQPIRRRRGTRALSRTMKPVILALCEKKNKRQPDTFNGGSSFNHDTLYELKLHDRTSNSGVTAIPQGNGDTQRNGSDVYSYGVRVRGTFSMPSDRRNTTIKIWLVEYNSSQGNPTTKSEFFYADTGNTMLDGINNVKFPGTRLLRTLRVTARDLQDQANSSSVYYDIWIPLKRQFKYDSTGVVCPAGGAKEHISLIMTPYDNPAALVTDTVITHHENLVMWYYKDP